MQASVARDTKQREIRSEAVGWSGAGVATVRVLGFIPSGVEQFMQGNDAL